MKTNDGNDKDNGSGRKKLARQNQLPGMENAAIKAIEEAAFKYAEIRDQRKELTQEEVALKGKLIELLHKNKITVYKRGNIDIELVVEAEKVRVRVASEKPLDDGEADESGDAEG